MRQISIILMIALVGIQSCAQEPKTPKDWLAQNTVELEPEGNYDFTAIGEAIGDKKIMAIGESSHGLGKFYELKAALVQYLHQEKGFEVLAMEGGLGDINLAYLTIDTLSGQQLRDVSLFGNFLAKEVNPLFEHIKSASNSDTPLHYTGYDTQSSNNYFTKSLQIYLKASHPDLSASLPERFSSNYKMVQAARGNDSLGYYRERNLYMETAKQAKKAITDNKKAIQEEFDLVPFQLEIVERTLTMFYKSVDLPYTTWWKGNELRDELMAENLQWLIDTVYKNKKVIVWAHNGHIEKSGITGGNIKWMGHYLSEAYKNDYYALGLFAYKGKTYQHWTGKTVPFENKDSTFIERIMTDTGKKTAFLNLNTVTNTKNTAWLFDTVDAYEVENGGNLRFVPMARFDGVITVFESGIPTYDK